MKAIKNTIYTLCFCVVALSAFLVLGYDNTVIHPKLSLAGIEIYGKNTDAKLTREQVNWIVEGSIAEDTDPRYLNHFYDPTTSKGLNDGIFSGKSAKEWAQKQDSLTGDYSESAIMENYQQGDYKRAYQGIGHILHLIQDMSVPAHTRNDAHPDGDPYEKWAKQNGDVSPNNASFVKIDNLNQVFDELAGYSHNNFFSKDTIDKKEFFVGRDGYVYCIDNFNNKYKCLKEVITPSLVYFTIGDDNIHLDYWNLLYPKAVGYSAGTIDYFTRQFEQIEREKREEKIGFWQRTKNKISETKSDTKYTWGDLVIYERIGIDVVWESAKTAAMTTAKKVKSAAVATAEMTKTAAQKTTAAIGNAIDGIKNTFSDKKVSPMAGVANIGQIVGVSHSEKNEESLSAVIPAEAGIQTSKNLDSRLHGNDKKEGGNDKKEYGDDDKKEVERSEERAMQTQFKEVEPLNSKKEVQPLASTEIIHAPYQRPAVVVSGNTGGSGAIANQFQGQFNGSVAPIVIVSEATQSQEESQPESQNTDSSPVAQNDNSEEEAAPEAPQEESQEPSDVIPVETGIQDQEEPQPENQNTDSSPEAQNDGVEDAVQNDEEESSQDDTQSEQVANETSTESETSQSEPQPEPQPTIPNIQFYLTDYNVRSQNFALNWQDANNIIQNWELEYRLGANFGWEILKQVQDDNGENSYNFTAQYDDLTYYFRLRGSDASGNLTEWQALQADISTNPVAINEIAWMGTQASTDDEWIELANKTDQEIDLTGWTLKESDGAPEIILTGKIAPNGFYLLERTDDTTVANITADQIYTGALNNPQSSSDYGNDLTLSDADGNIIDQTKVAYNGVNNFNSKMSSERVSIWADSNNQDNWQYFWNSYLTVPADAKDAGNNTISGTPKSRNSWADRFFSISTDIAKNTTLLKDRGTVKVINNINISGGATLNIEPGTVLKFGSSQFGFNVASGGILAKGTADNKIVFTSSNDNTYGIQTGYSSPLYGDWGKINFGENTTGEFDNIIFRYSGSGTATPSIQGYKSNIKISNSYFDNNKYDILSVESSDIDIASNTFKNNNHNGITITEGTSNITGNIFDWLANPGVGIYIKSQNGTINISNNQFTSMYSPIAMDYLGNFTIQDNQASGNSYNGIIINSPLGYSYDEEIYLDSNMVYVVRNFIYYTGPKLKFAPGTIVKFGGALYVQGDFEAIGTADKPITFTKIGDDSVGGASGSNGGSSPPSYWNAFHISGATNVTMDYFTIKHGGNGWNYVNEDIDGKCLKVFNGVQNFTFTNSTMTWCGRGLYSYTDNAQIENSVFSSNSFNLESYAQTGWISNTTFGNTLVEMLTISGYQQVSY